MFFCTFKDNFMLYNKALSYVQKFWNYDRKTENLNHLKPYLASIKL